MESRGGGNRAEDPALATTSTLAEPWLAEPAWRDNRIASQARSRLAIMWFLAAVFCALGGILLIAVIPQELRNGNHAILATLIFPLAGLGMLVSAVRQWLAWRRFGALALELDPFPGSLGGDAGGTLDLPVRFHPGQRYEVTLACCRVYEKSNGDSRETREDVIWDRRGLAEAKPTTTGTRLAVRFSPPEDLPESTPKSGDYKRWSLHFHAGLPGADLDRLFVIPVYRTGGKEARRRHPDSVEALVRQPVHVLPPGVVRLREQARGIELHYPVLRNLSLSAVIGIFAAICVGASVFLTSAFRWPAAESGFDLLFEGAMALGLGFMVLGSWAVSAGLTLATLYMLGNSLRVSVTQDEIVARRRVFGIALPARRLATAEVEAIEAEVPARSGVATNSTKYRDLVAKGPGRAKVIVAEGVRDPAVLEHLRRRILQAGRLRLDR